jgi:hypothetical protein
MPRHGVMQDPPLKTLRARVTLQPFTEPSLICVNPCSPVCMTYRALALSVVSPVEDDSAVQHNTRVREPLRNLQPSVALPPVPQLDARAPYRPRCKISRHSLARGSRLQIAIRNYAWIVSLSRESTSSLLYTHKIGALQIPS